MPQRISLQLFTALFLVTSSVAVVTAQDPDAAPAAESAGDGTNLADLLDIKINEHVKVKLGAGARISLRATENGAENGSNWSEDVNLDNMRIYLSAKAFDWFGIVHVVRCAADEIRRKESTWTHPPNSPILSVV